MKAKRPLGAVGRGGSPVLMSQLLEAKEPIMTGTENLIRNTATVALVLGREDLSTHELRTHYGDEWTLVAVLNGLLNDLEDAVVEQGEYEIPLLINADMVATLMQVEIGAQVTVRRSGNSVNALSQRQWLTMV